MKASRLAARSTARRSSVGIEPTRLAGEDVRHMFRQLTAWGPGVGDAGNLSGFAVGLRPMARAWTPREITALLFLRELVRQERIVH